MGYYGTCHLLCNLRHCHARLCLFRPYKTSKFRPELQYGQFPVHMEHWPNDFLFYFQEYVLPDVRDREYLITFHKNAKKVGFDVDKYNQLKDQIYKIETDLHRLRDPLALHLPLKTRLGSQAEIDMLSSESSQGIVSKIQQIFKKSGSTSQS